VVAIVTGATLGAPRSRAAKAGVNVRVRQPSTIDLGPVANSRRGR
jgi:hypothetical protein